VACRASAELPIRSFSQRIDHVLADDGTGAASRAVFSTIEVLRDADFHSVAVNRLAAKGTHLEDATILFASTGLKIRLHDLVVDSVGVDTAPNGVLQERVSLAFARINWEWSDGGPSLVAEWDIVGNKGGGGGEVSPGFVFFGPGVPVQPQPGETTFTKLTVSTTGSPVFTGGGGAGAKSLFSPVTMLTGFGRDTIQLLSAAATGIHIERIDARFTALEADGTIYEPLKYSFFGATVTSIALVTTPTGALQQTLGLNYQRIQWLGQPPGGGGSHLAGWDLKQAKEF